MRKLVFGNNITGKSNNLSQLLLLLYKLITEFCQIRGHGGIKRDDLTWNDPVVHIYMYRRVPRYILLPPPPPKKNGPCLNEHIDVIMNAAACYL